VEIITLNISSGNINIKKYPDVPPFPKPEVFTIIT
jgi:hypothetical protein